MAEKKLSIMDGCRFGIGFCLGVIFVTFSMGVVALLVLSLVTGTSRPAWLP